MQTAKNLIKLGSAFLHDHKIKTCKIDAEVLLAHVLNIDRYKLIIDSNLLISAEQENAYQAMLSRRSKHEPISYITENKEFWGLNFYVNPHVLIPRPDSETLIELTLKYLEKRDNKYNMLDLGTGSGCLLIALLHELPNSYGIGIDQSSDALEVAKINAARQNLTNRSHFIESNWFTALKQQKFDVTISNPPYIETFATLDDDVAKFEPSQALYGGKSGLDAYEQIAQNAKEYLVGNGLLIVEIGINQATSVSEIFQSNGFILLEQKQDLAGIVRALAFKLPT